MVTRCCNLSNQKDSRSGRLSRIPIYILSCFLIVTVLSLSAAAAYNPWGNRRISGLWYGSNYDYTYGSDYDLFGGYDFEFIGNPSDYETILEGIRWGMSIGSEGIVIPVLFFHEGMAAFRLRIYIKNLNVDCFPDFQSAWVEEHSRDLARSNNWTVDMRLYTYSQATTRTLRFYSEIGDYYSAYTYSVPAGTTCVQISAWPQTSARARFTEAFQLKYGYEAVQDDGGSYMDSFGSAVSDFFSATSPLFNSQAFGTILGVFVGGCIVVLILKMGVSL